jgi:hypothetical protein
MLFLQLFRRGPSDYRKVKTGTTDFLKKIRLSGLRLGALSLLIPIGWRS